MQEMKLQELKAKSPTELLSFAEEVEVENASAMRKQELMFAILKQLAAREVEITGTGVVEVYERLAREALALEGIGKVLVLCPPPVKERGDLAEMFKGAEERFTRLNVEMERFATETGAAFMDAGRVIEVDEIDGVHWSLESHEFLGRAVAEKLKEIIG